MWALACGLSVGLAAFVLVGSGGDAVARPSARSRAELLGEELVHALRASPALAGVRERQGLARLSARCERQMPEMLDILALGLSAGLSFDASLALYCDRCDTELAGQLSVAMRSWQMGLASRQAALTELAGRIEAPALAKFAAAVREALAFGAPLASTLERQADAIRADQRSGVERRIEEVPVRMLIPLGTLVVPAMLLAIMGPLLSAAFAR